MRKTKSFYELLNEYSVKEINIAIEKLDKKEKAILLKKYNEGLDKSPSKETLTKEEQKNFYGIILAKVKRYLKNPSVKPRQKRQKSKNPETQQNKTEENFSIEKIVEEDTKEQEIPPTEAPLLPEKKSEREEQIPETIVPPETVPIISTDKKESPSQEKQLPYSYVYSDKNINNSSNMWSINLENTYQLILNMLSSFSFQDLAQNLGMKDAFIISLRLGIDTTDGYCYSIEEIANFLKITPEEVIESTNNILELCKKSLNATIDMALKVTKGTAKVLKQSSQKSSQNHQI